MAIDKGGESHKVVADPLALERTAMANERTLLSYIRTAIMLFATSVTMFYLVRDVRMIAVAAVVFVAAVFTAAFGVWRHQRLQRKIAKEASWESSDK